MDYSKTPRIFNVYKPVGMTSSDVVYHFKKNLQRPFGKIGHFGTLDPFAEGVLLIGTGGACRLTDYAHKFLPKTYLAVGKLGQKMSTGDVEGEVVEEKNWEHIKNLTTDELQKVCESFLGDYMQSPPAFSAAKHKGKPLYKWARQGIEIKKDQVKRVIYKIQFVDLKDELLILRVTVSTGTYIRTLFEDLSEKLDTVGHLIELKREFVGELGHLKALSKKEWPSKEQDQSTLHHFDMPQLLPFRTLKLSDAHSKKYSNGMTLTVEEIKIMENDFKIDEASLDFSLVSYLWVYGSDDDLLGLAKIEEDLLKSCFNLPQKQS